MSQSPPQLFTLTLRHLSGDGKKVGVELPKVTLPYFSAKQIQTLLTSIAALAPTVAYPAEPEIRIKGEGAEFVVRVTGGQLHLVSWSSAHKGGVATPAEIVAAVTGEGVEEGGGTSPAGKTKAGSKGWGEKLTLVGLGIAILAVNAFTVWFLTRPPRTLLADYRPIAPERAERVIAEVAGVYETGKNAGDRRLEIAPPSFAKRVKFGAKGAVKDVQNFDVKPVESGGGLALLMGGRKALIKIKDNLSLVVYGDTYTRVPN